METENKVIKINTAIDGKASTLIEGVVTAQTRDDYPVMIFHCDGTCMFVAGYQIAEGMMNKPRWAVSAPDVGVAWHGHASSPYSINDDDCVWYSDCPQCGDRMYCSSFDGDWDW